MCQITEFGWGFFVVFFLKNVQHFQELGFRKIRSVNSAVVQRFTGVSKEFQWNLGYLFTHSTAALETQTQQL